VQPGEPAPLPPLAVPQVRYGELPLPRLTEPVAIAPVKNGSVVVIVVDALNAGHMSAYGYERATTPRIAALAGQGVLYTNWISNSSWTRPSYTTLVTGLPKREHGVELNETKLADEITTLGEVFKAAGYRTAAFVGNPLVREMFGYGQGFDRYHDPLDEHRAFPRGGILVEKAIKWLGRVGDKPFFLLLFLTDPHTPYRPLADYRRFLDEVGVDEATPYPLREYVEPLPEREHRGIVAAYDGEVLYTDTVVGRLLDALDEAGRLERTTVVITADHGEMFGEHNCYLHAYHMWEPALRVPFVIASPAIGVRGAIDDRPHTHEDLLPTLADLVGLEAPAGVSGVSLARSLADPTLNRERELFSQYDARGVKRQSARLGRWKLVHHHQVDRGRFYGAMKRQREASPVPRARPDELPSVAFDGERYELYDLVADIAEQNDLFQSRPGEPITAALKQAIDRGLGRFAESGEPIELSDETLEALRAAGYIQ
jgi:arylsulfatase